MDETLDTNPQPVSYVQPGIASIQEKPLWQSDAFIVLLLVAFWPVGIIFMWLYAPWRKLVKILLTVLFFLPIILFFLILGFILSIFYGSRKDVVSYTPPPNSINSEEWKFLYVEDLKDGNTKVTSPKFKYTYVFPSDVKYTLPFGNPRDNEYWGIQYRVNDTFNAESGFYTSPSVSVTTLEDSNGSIWRAQRGVPEVVQNLKDQSEVPEQFRSYDTVVSYSQVDDSNTIEFFNQGIIYRINITRKLWNSKGYQDLPREDVIKAQKVYDNIVSTFTIMQ